jgi:F0F1-type ATP synthase assembly protein I
MKIAVFDLSLTLIGGYIVGKKLGYNPWIISVSMIPLGIIVHEIMGIETEISKKIKE